MSRETTVTRKRLNDIAREGGAIERQLSGWLVELEDYAELFPDHVEGASEPLTRAIMAIEAFRKAVSL